MYFYDSLIGLLFVIISFCTSKSFSIVARDTGAVDSPFGDDLIFSRADFDSVLLYMHDFK